MKNSKLKSDSTESTYKIQVATFFLDKKLFGIPIQDVLEIFKNVEMTPVPLAPDYLEGVINLRGQIVTAINLKKRLNMPKIHHNDDTYVEEEEEYNNIIIGSSRNDSVSLLVDNIGDVLEITSDIIEPPPDTIKGLDPKYVKNVCKLKGGLLVVLDSSAILSEE
jgi:purine-binding chemotaxis protein CheW